jgi:Holliday junction resolvase RusA-like endonuclease
VTAQLPLDLDALALTPVTGADLADTSILSWQWRLWVPGIPAPQGSKEPLPIYAGKGPNRRLVRIVLRESSNVALKKWRATVDAAARKAWTTDPYGGPFDLGCRFLMPVWQATRTGDWPTNNRIGDLSHLVRAVEDALKTAGVIKDDRYVVGYLGTPDTSKRFARPGEETGCEIIMRPARPQPGQWDGFRPPVRHRTPRPAPDDPQLLELP